MTSGVRKGQVKVVAKNGGGEDSCVATLSIGGRAPEFIEKPLKCTVLDGTCSISVYRHACSSVKLYAIVVL